MTEREDQGDDRTALDHVVEQFIAAADAAAADVEPHSRWVFLTLLAEAHLRASIEIRRRARKCAPRTVRRGACA
jgi:hypothetical protein